MGGITISSVTNANVYINGNSFLGKIEEAKMPVVKHTMTEKKALGMVGKLETWAGFDKMEATLKINSMYKDLMTLIANPTKAVQLQLRSYIETQGSQGSIGSAAMVTYLTGVFKEIDLGNFKQHDNVEISAPMTVSYIKQVIDGQDIIEIDAYSNIYKVNGEDILASYKNAIGG
ncbi:MAG: phage major tail tube protein [Campylobacterales bacterium]|nr:phage major tail tube protein [Campylobacterales bacterium]